MARCDNRWRSHYQGTHAPEGDCGRWVCPIRIMFYYPNRSQAIRIQQTSRKRFTAVSMANTSMEMRLGLTCRGRPGQTLGLFWNALRLKIEAKERAKTMRDVMLHQGDCFDVLKGTLRLAQRISFTSIRRFFTPEDAFLTTRDGTARYYLASWSVAHTLRGLHDRSDPPTSF